MMRWIEIDMLEKSEEAYQHLFVLDLLAPVRKKVLILIDFLFVSTFTKDIITPCRPNDIPSENSGLERQKEQVAYTASTCHATKTLLSQQLTAYTQNPEKASKSRSTFHVVQR